MNIVYIGDMMPGGTCRQRFQALQRLGHNVIAFNSVRRYKQYPTLSTRLTNRIGLYLDTTNAYSRARKLCDNFKPRIIWLDKALSVPQRFFRHCLQMRPRPLIVGYSPDDMSGAHNQSSRFLRSLPYYDVFFTTKSYNVPELLALGCNEVRFVGNAYDPIAHSPRSVTNHERCRLGGPLGFIGAWERDRAVQMQFLGENGYRPRWWCGRPRLAVSRDFTHIRLETKSLWADDYRAAINSFDINLCFLRKINRDLQTQRSIEIPACRQFMLAERTDEHLELFQEGKEAEFFSSKQELLDKVRFYSAHTNTRQSIANNGYERCISSGYSNDARLTSMLSLIT